MKQWNIKNQYWQVNVFIVLPITIIFLFGVWGFIMSYFDIFTSIKNDIYEWQSIIGAFIGSFFAYILFNMQRRTDSERQRKYFYIKFEPSIETARTIEKSIKDVKEKISKISTPVTTQLPGGSYSINWYATQIPHALEFTRNEIIASIKRVNFLDEVDHQGCSIKFFESKSAIKSLLKIALNDCNQATKIHNNNTKFNIAYPIWGTAFSQHLQNILDSMGKLERQPKKMISDIQKTIDRAIP